ncbi:AAA family ATPase [Desulfuribacillus alkaliarsenatis]|uniref:ATPase n=1 Tax=Desulfuribacillus alkaliarsenatis TaxID=766136 RepID=A0A1E5FZI6_9FIRM|nr:AAA family ATPase [Desulfuribacillus alkaliarsenatis]OEF95991.1 ATPase [Desulfuribacillus alkaliarsenatis]
MTKSIIIGVIPAILIFLFLLGFNIAPVVFILVLIGLIFLLIYSKDGFSNVLNKPNHRINNSDIKFEQIGGQARAKREIKEALEFVLKADEYKEMGIRALKGLLLVGPPGTGKTLLAKAAANYTNSVYFAASGSEFVEMYVGMGAKRVREIFNNAYKEAEKENKSSAIIFIDEIDVIGQKREASSNNKEYDQTLNQLLTEMDGIKENDKVKVLVLAATNRVDILDPALLRPGRFDRKVMVDLPDKEGRKQILEIHTQKKSLAEDVSIEFIVNKTFGFSGAELENLVNEASILALRNNKQVIQKHHIIEAIDKVMIGEKSDRKPNEEEIRRVAYHELGHAVTTELLNPGTVANISITPRGGALGYVRQADTEDRYLYTKDFFDKQIMIALAGAVAEQEFLGNKSTGAQNDFSKALQLAKQVVTSGLTELGIIDKDLNKKEYTEKVNSIIRELEIATVELVQNNKTAITDIFHVLIDKETIDGDEFRSLLRK